MQKRPNEHSCAVTDLGCARDPLAIASLLMLSALTVAIAPMESRAQTSAVPPSSVEAARAAEARVRRQSEELRKEAVKDGVTASFGTITRGGAILNHSMGNDGTVLQMNAANKGARVIDRLMTGADLGAAYGEGGMGGLKTEATQLLIDKSIQGGAEALIERWAVRRAIGAGVAGAVASGGAAIAFDAGLIAGGVINGIVVNGKTIEGHVDDAYFNIAPDWAKEMASGVKQVDIDSSDFQREQYEKSIRLRRMNFERVQRDNEVQQAQAAAARAPTMSTPMQDEPTSPSGTQIFLDSLNASLQQYTNSARNMTPTRSTPAITLAAPQSSTCTIDPKTSCHPGHDEKAHPGGCKCAR